MQLLWTTDVWIVLTRLLSGAGTGGATKSILEGIGSTFSSYTYTDISVGFFEKAAELFKEYRDKMAFRVLDVEKSPSASGYEPHSYDIVIASNVLHATASLQKTLDNTRQLLKPGGYLMLLELTNNGPVRFSNIMGGLPGWWLGVDDGRKYAPTITPGQWHSALRRAGFSGIDAITPNVDVLAWPFSIMAAQAVDGRVNFLRRPLVPSTSSSTSVYLDSVVILGTGSLESSRIAEEVSEHLGRFCGQMTILAGLPTEDEALALNPMSTFINLVDLDSPIFNRITSEKMEGMKRVFELAKHILWITLGAQTDEPYHMASISFSRAMSHEAAHISMNHLDFSRIDSNVSKVIAESLLRQCALDEWSEPIDRQQHQKFLWSQETEGFVDDGKLKISRLVDNFDQNSRLNSSRRVITKTKPVSSSAFSISLSANSPPSLVEETLPMPIGDCQGSVRVDHSSLMALHIAPDTFLFLGIGEPGISRDRVITLSTTNSCKRAPVVSVAAESNTELPDCLLVAVASDLLATSLTEAVASGSRLLVHCSGKDRFLAAALSRQAVDKNISVFFSCDAESTDEGQDEAWIKLNARTPRYDVQKSLLPTSPTHFLDLTAQSQTQPDDLSTSISEVLPTWCKRVDASEISQPDARLSCNPETLRTRLAGAVSAGTSAAASLVTDNVQDLVIPLDQLQHSSLSNRATSVVQWPLNGDVTVEVRPLDGGHLFSSNKTYLLVGLSGEIGRSLCEWMVSNGAGCVCLTSRNPKINQKWLQSFEGTKSTVKVFAMYVTICFPVQNGA